MDAKRLRFASRVDVHLLPGAQRPGRWLVRMLLVCACIGIALVANMGGIAGREIAHAAAPQADWNQYLHDLQNTSASNEAILSTTNAKQLSKLWTFKTGSGVAAAAAVVGNTVYIGSWDGYEYALDLATGAQKWKTFLGQSVNPACNPATIGVTSSAEVLNGVVYVGGGDNYWYALDGTTGTVLWKVNTGDNSATGGHYNWASPLIYNGVAYVGIASNCDNPLVQGQLLKVDLTSHQVTGTASLVPDGQVGGGIWTRPGIDTATNTIFVTTGTQNQFTQTMSQAFVSIDATSMAIKDSWQIPLQNANIDADFGNSPILLTDANGRQLVVATNKNGYTYALLRSDLKAGPVWQAETGIGGECPPCGDGSVSSGAYANGTIFMAGGNTTINGVGVAGSVRALDPTSGHYLWEHGLPSAVIPALAYDNGLLVDGAGSNIEVLNAANGQRLYNYQTGGIIYGPPVIANGTIIEGSGDGVIYALALPTTTPPTPPVDPNCANGWTCQDIGGATPAGSDQVTNGNWTINAGGSGLAGTTDQARLITHQSNGDVQLNAQITAQPTTNATSQAGLIVRQSADPTAPYYAVFVTPNNGLTVQYRTASGGATTVATQLTTATLPLYLEIQRSGDTFQAATSTDGTNYTLVPGSQLTALLPAAAMAGLITSSTLKGTTGSATYSHVTIGALNNTPTPQPSPSPCPASWNCADIGNPAQVGDQTLTNSTWTVKGGGQDINGHADQFHYVWQPVAANETISMHVTAQTASAPLAKTGVMIRQSTDANASFYGAFVTPTNGIIVLYRDGAGIRSTQQATVAGKVPTYIQVTRWSNVFSAYTSTDGNTWTYLDGSSVSMQSLTGATLGGIAVSSTNPGALSTATIDSVSMVASATQPPSICPDTWSCADVGYPTPGGSQTLSNGTWKIRAGGNDIWFNADQFRYMWQSQTGDSTISARVVSQTSPDLDPWAKAGVMMRQTADPDSPYYAAFLTAGNGIGIQYRSTRGGNTTQAIVAGITAPAYLQIARSGNSFTAYTSTDGITWTYVEGTSITLNLPATILTGLAATSHNSGIATTVTIDNVHLTNSAPLAPTACPNAQWSCEDIGTPALTGDQQLNNGVWTIHAAGGDIWGTSDEFHYIQQNLTGDGSISTHVLTQSNTDPWSKAGVMLRQTTDPGSPYYAAFTSPGHGIVIQSRSVQGGTSQQAVLAGTVPIYLQVTRYGTSFSAYTSADGSNWTYVPGSTITLNMTGTILAGLAVTSHNALAISTVTMDTVNVNSTELPPPTVCPASWGCADIGNPLLAGDQQLNNGIWTIDAAGGDIWGTADQFHAVTQTLPGDGSVSARVLTQTNTDTWSKAGVMLRASSDAGSPYYALLVTPNNGVFVQYRTTIGGQSTQIAGPNITVPVYLKVTRTGTNFSTYTSPDGTTWTLVPGSNLTLNMTGNVLAGLAVTSHNPSIVGTAKFSAVTVG